MKEFTLEEITNRYILREILKLPQFPGLKNDWRLVDTETWNELEFVNSDLDIIQYTEEGIVKIFKNSNLIFTTRL